MAKLIKPDDIITLPSTAADRRTAAAYASRTLPWTFNRMSKNTGVRGQNERGLNIAKGIVCQEVLRRYLEGKGISVELQRKSHRAEDLFDFRICSDGTIRKIDVKSIAYYNDYPDVGRPPFSKKLILDNRDYPGPDWRRFFPMLMAHTQIHQEKETFIFAISESPDFRRTVLEGRSDHLIVAYPNGEAMPFYTYKKLCLEREQANRGFSVGVEYEPSGLFGKDKVEVTVLYEWAGSNKEETVVLKAGNKAKLVGPMSILNCISISVAQYEQLNGLLVVRVGKNDFNRAVLNSQMENINTLPEEALTYTRDDFCNLVLPDAFKLHCIGWISKVDFLEACKKYPAWVWPIDSSGPEGKFLNTPWSQIGPRDVALMERLGAADRITKKPSGINFGLMKTSGQGQGACCYVFPNIRRTGVRETNLYILPQDLQTLESFR